MKLAAARLLTLVLLTCGAAYARADDLGGRPPRLTMAQAEATSEVLVFLKAGTDVEQYARDHGLVVRRVLRSDPNAYVLRAASTRAATAAVQVAGTDSRVRSVYVNRRTHYVRTAFVPDDPYFHKIDTPAPGWPGQWHLLNEHVAGLDANVQPAWDQDITGNGVTIGIIDDGLETAHPDLSLNYVAADSWDFGQGDADPNPVYFDDKHGTAVAGVAAARGGNGIGVVGAAPYAGLAGLRIDFPNQTVQMFVDATLYHSSDTNTNIKVKNHSYAYQWPYISMTAEVDALQASVGAGTIHCVSAGNERGEVAEDCNKLDLQNSPFAITVAALGSDGKYASYSNFGSCVFVTAPSSSDDLFDLLRITTTDRMGEGYGYNGGGDSFPDSDYTSRFGGTSSSSPIVAGVIALGQEAKDKEGQAAMNTRLAKHLLVKSCDVVDASDAEWQTNAVGNSFNPNYGFGLINAGEFTRLAPLYASVTTLANEATGTVSVGEAIPDEDPNGISRIFDISNTAPLEEVRVYLKFTHADSGDLEAYLTSPGGTQSRLMKYANGDDTTDLSWTFTTNEFWGETPYGTWTLLVRDVVEGISGSWVEFSVVVLMGELVPREGPPAIALHPVDRMVSFDGTAIFTVEAVGTQPLAYQWQKDEINLEEGGDISGATSATLEIANVDSDDLGYYRCVVTNGLGNATSDSAALRILFMVESRTGGLNYNRYSEVGTLYSSGAKSNAPCATADIGSRWADMDSGASGVNKAVYSFTSPVAARYEVFVTWPASANASDNVEHIVTHAGGWASVFLDQDSDSNPGGANSWNSLGQYNLTSGDPYTVTQTNEDYPDPGEVFRADAVLWELISVGGGPTVTEQPSPQNVCPGGTAIFTVSATGQGTLTYQWQKDTSDLSDGGDISGATSDTLQIENADSADIGDYRCVVTDENDSTPSNAAPLTLGETVVTKHPSDQTPPGGGTAIFTVEATGIGELLYQWKHNGLVLFDGGDISGATTDTLQITNVDSSDEGQYSCYVESDCGSVNSNSAALTLYTGHVEFVVESRSGGLNYDQCSITGSWTEAVLKSSAPGTTPGIGSLYSVPGQPDRTVVYRYTPIVNGTYEVFATWASSSNACSSAKHVVTRVGGADTVYADQLTGGNQWNSLGVVPLLLNTEYTVTQYSDGSSGGTVVRVDAAKWELGESGIHAPAITVVALGDETLLYQWQKDEQNLSDDDRISGATTDTLQIAELEGADEGSYRCVVSNGLGDATSDSAQLTVTPAVVSCLMNAGFEEGFVSGVAADWVKFNRIGDVTCEAGTHVYSGTYSQRVYCEGSEVGGIYQQFDVTPGGSYSVSVWIKCDDGGGMQGWLGVDPYGGTDPWSGSIWWGSIPYPDFSPKTWNGTALGSSGKITVFLEAEQTRSWQTGYCWFDDVEPACPGGPPIIMQHPASASITEGSTAMFMVRAGGDSPFWYQWQKDTANLFDDGNISGATSATLRVSSVDSSDEGSYRCVASNLQGDTPSNAASLTVIPSPGACLLNVGFEDGFVEGVGTYWTRFTSGGIMTWESSSDPHTGVSSQRVYSARSGNEGGVYQQFDAVASQQYTAKVFIKTSNSDMLEGYLGIDPAGGTDWSAVLPQHKDGATSETWSQQSVTVTATGDSGKVTVFLWGHSVHDIQGGYIYFDDAAPDCFAPVPPLVETAVSCKEHGTAGECCINVLDRTDDEDIEPRENGTTKLVVGFDIDLQRLYGDLTDVSLTSGSVDSITLSAADELTIEMSDTPDAEPLTVTFPGIADAGNADAVCTDDVCIRPLVGDVRADGVINLFDLIDIRNYMDETVTCDIARRDVRSDGLINLFDTIDVRDNMDANFMGTCP